VFQFGNAPAVNAQGVGTGAAQHLADQWFQALARGTTNPSDTALVFGTVKDAWERTLASQVLLAPPPPDNLDGLSWEEAGADRNGSGVSGSPALGDSRARRDVANSVTRPAALAPAALDQYFAQGADATDQTTEDE